jgi:RecJ-like exonuclease
MKTKLLTALLIGLLLSSATSLVVAKEVRCPACNGSGIIDCPECGGTGEITQSSQNQCGDCSGTGVLTPRVYMHTMQVSTYGGATHISATFENRESFSVQGRINVTLSGQSVITDTVTFSQNQQLSQEIVLPFTTTFSTMQLMNAVKIKVVDLEEITCPYCEGTGNILLGRTCTECRGTGSVDCPDCGGGGYVDEAVADQIRQGEQVAGLDLTIIAGAVVAVGLGGGFAGFFLLKKRRLSESSLRRLSSSEFQAWVLKRLDGKPPGSMDTAIGIDGYTSVNQPIQIRQSDSVGMNAVDLFASMVARKKASGGVMVAFNFADDAIRGKVRARRSLNLDIQMLTVRELVESRRPY